MEPITIYGKLLQICALKEIVKRGTVNANELRSTVAETTIALRNRPGKYWCVLGERTEL